MLFIFGINDSLIGHARTYKASIPFFWFSPINFFALGIFHLYCVWQIAVVYEPHGTSILLVVEQLRGEAEEGGKKHAVNLIDLASTCLCYPQKDRLSVATIRS